jgi:ribosomal protein L17
MDTKDYAKYAEKYKNEFKEQEQQNRSYAETLMKSDNFNDTFNKLFEDNVKKNEEDAGGYDEWLRGSKQEERIVDYDKLVTHRNQDVNQFKQEIRQMTMDEFQMEFEKRRADMIAGTEIISRDGFGAISSMSSAGASNLLGGPVGDYSSAHGGAGLAYQDLKRAHTDTLIPVDAAAMADRFMRSGDYERFLKTREETITPLGKEESERILNEQYKTDEATNIRNTFKLMQQQEQQQKIMDKIWGKLKQLTYGDK